MASPKRNRDLTDRARLESEIEAASVDADTDATRRKIVLEHLKLAIEHGRTSVQTRFEANEIDGNKAKGELAFLFDQVIRIVHDAAARAYPSANPTAGDRLAVVAVGGYGRGELAPYSDIDLLFLFPWKQTARGEQLVEYMLYMLRLQKLMEDEFGVVAKNNDKLAGISNLAEKLGSGESVEND